MSEKNKGFIEVTDYLNGDIHSINVMTLSSIRLDDDSQLVSIATNAFDEFYNCYLVSLEITIKESYEELKQLIKEATI